MFQKNQSGNPNGRPSGKVNKVTSEVKSIIEDLIHNNIMNFKSDMAELKPIERIGILIKLLPYVVPKLESIQVEYEKEEKKKSIVETIEEAIEKMSPSERQKFDAYMEVLNEEV